MNIASLGNEAICDGQRSYMRWASKLYSFFCLFFVLEQKHKPDKHLTVFCGGCLCRLIRLYESANSRLSGLSTQTEARTPLGKLSGDKPI